MRLDAFERGPQRPSSRSRDLTTLVATLQPDQQPSRWDGHVAGYELVFEPLTNALARDACEALCVEAGTRLLDVGAGAGGAAILAARRGAFVTAIDASPAMVRRIDERVRHEGVNITARQMDGAALEFPHASFDAALSLFGIVLFPDPVGALREIGRVLVPGGRVAVATWTEPQRYELVGRLLAAIAAVGTPAPPPATPPAQLRFREEADFRALFDGAGFRVERITRVETALRAPSARWLAERLDFAPGIGAMLAGQGDRLSDVRRRFVQDLERDQGTEAIALEAVAFIGLGSAGSAVR
jgi:ubiquinone/menaquinone biosynthesis C-methylase UbiE